MVVRAPPRTQAAWSSLGFVVLVGGLLAIYFFLGAGEQNVLFDSIAVVAAGAMFVGLIRRQAEPRFAWMLLAAGTMLMAVGDIVFGTSQPVPSVADMLYVSAYVALTLGFVGLVRSEFPSRRGSSRLDAIVVVAGVAILGMLMLIVPAAHPDGAGLAAQAVSLGYPAIDLILLLILFKPAHRPGARRIVFLLLAAGLLVRLVGDAGYALSGFGTTYVEGDAADAFWLLSYALFAAALLHPSIGQVKMDTPSIWTPRPDFAPDEEPDVPARPGSTIQSHAMKFRRVLALAGGTLMALAAVTLLLAVSWHAPEISLVSGAYGGSGVLIMVASAVAT
ncbi:MAG: hypothetical protein ACXVEI_07765 [Actinomycetota bacterium]